MLLPSIHRLREFYMQHDDKSSIIKYLSTELSFSQTSIIGKFNTAQLIFPVNNNPFLNIIIYLLLIFGICKIQFSN
jgi:hypothetical protein